MTFRWHGGFAASEAKKKRSGTGGTNNKEENVSREQLRRDEDACGQTEFALYLSAKANGLFLPPRAMEATYVGLWASASWFFDFESEALTLTF